MLSVLIYEPDDARRDAMYQTLAHVPGAAMLKIILNTGSAASFARMLTEIRGAALVILGLALHPTDNRKRCLEFGSTLARQNRDCYTVYSIHELDDLPSLLPQCARPAGILLGDFTQSQASACFERILEDYAAISNEGSNADSMLVESGAATYRLPYSQILYIEALNKKLNICTMRQSISVRRSLNSVADGLPDCFLRSHRSYVVNMEHVVSTDYKEMLLTMSDGSQLPIARSMKDALHEHFTQPKGGGA